MTIIGWRTRAGVGLAALLLLVTGCRAPAIGSQVAAQGKEGATDGHTTYLPLTEEEECEGHTALATAAASATQLRVGELVIVTITLENKGCGALGVSN